MLLRSTVVGSLILALVLNSNGFLLPTNQIVSHRIHTNRQTLYLASDISEPPVHAEEEGLLNEAGEDSEESTQSGGGLLNYDDPFAEDAELIDFIATATDEDYTEEELKELEATLEKELGLDQEEAERPTGELAEREKDGDEEEEEEDYDEDDDEYDDDDYEDFSSLFDDSPDLDDPPEGLIEKILQREAEIEARRIPKNQRPLFKARQAALQKNQRHEKDCGSPEVQIAVTHERILHLTKHLMQHRKDQHTKRGLEKLVQLRKTNLNYLYKQNPQKAVALAAELGIRFQPPGRPWDRSIRYGSFKNTKKAFKVTKAEKEAKRIKDIQKQLEL